MGLIAYRIRVFFRSHFKPVNQSVAERWKKTLNWIYVVSVWNALGAILYLCYKHPKSEEDENHSKVISPYIIARRFSGENSTIVHIKGFHDIVNEVVTDENLEEQID